LRNSHHVPLLFGAELEGERGVVVVDDLAEVREAAVVVVAALGLTAR
jgi:hypothetical protein